MRMTDAERQQAVLDAADRDYEQAIADGLVDPDPPPELLARIARRIRVADR
jgi:hypothetical protein